MKKIILALSSAQAILINKGYQLDDGEIEDYDAYLQVDSSSLVEANGQLEFPQAPLNL
jgi:hypothetical protein